MTTLQPIKKHDEYIVNSLEDANELIKDAMRQSTFQFVSVSRVFFTGKPGDSWKIVIHHEHTIEG